MYRSCICQMPLVFIAIVIAGCNGYKNDIRNTLIKFESESLILPERMLKVESGAISLHNVSRDTLLHFISSDALKATSELVNISTLIYYIRSWTTAI